MGREDWVSIGVQKELVKKLDVYLKSKEAKEFGMKNRQQMIGFILREFFKKGFGMFEKDVEIKNLILERNTATNMLEMMGKGIMGVNDMEDLNHERITSNKVIIRDKKLKKLVEVNIKEEMAYCTHHNASWCNHIGYVFYLSMMSAFQLTLKKKERKE